MFLRIPNLQFFKNVSITTIFTTKTLCSYFKRKQEFFREKNSWIRRFGICENMSRTGHKSFLFVILLFGCHVKRQS